LNKIEFLYNKDKYQGIDSSKALSHYGILGQKWGQRRWQNADGTFNEAGKERYFGPSGTTKKNKEEIEKIGEKYTKEQLRFQKYIAASEGFNLKYQRANGLLTEKGQKLLEAAMNGDEKALNKLNKKISPEWYNKVVSDPDKNTKEFFKELITKNKQNEAYDNEGVEGLDKNIKVTKNLKGKDISDEEFDKITKDTFKSVHDLSQKDYDEIADLGLYRMIQNGSLGNDTKPGDEGSREWFMEEDQTIGYPQIVDFYRKGYSKDYVEKYLQKINDRDISIYDAEELGLSPDLIERSYWPGSAIDNIYNNGSQDQKIGGLNSKEDAKANKEAVKMLADLNDKDYRKRAEMLDKLYNGSQFEEQRNNVDKAIKEKFKDDFDELEKTYGDFDKVENEYLALAGLNRALMDDGGKMEDISYMPRLYLYDDLNQGSLTAESIWAYDNGIDDSWDRWEKMVNKENSTRDELLNSLSNDGSYNSKVLSKLDDETKKDIVDHVYNYKSVPSSYWTLYNAGDTSKSEYDSVKDTTLKEAREISKKLSSSCGSDASGWALLNKAVNNLNLGGKDYTELTQADWDRINAEINSLKR